MRRERRPRLDSSDRRHTSPRMPFPCDSYTPETQLAWHTHTTLYPSRSSKHCPDGSPTARLARHGALAGCTMLKYSSHGALTGHLDGCITLNGRASPPLALVRGAP